MTDAMVKKWLVVVPLLGAVLALYGCKNPDKKIEGRDRKNWFLRQVQGHEYVTLAGVEYRFDKNGQIESEASIPRQMGLSFDGSHPGEILVTTPSFGALQAQRTNYVVELEPTAAPVELSSTAVDIRKDLILSYECKYQRKGQVKSFIHIPRGFDTKEYSYEAKQQILNSELADFSLGTQLAEVTYEGLTVGSFEGPKEFYDSIKTIAHESLADMMERDCQNLHSHNKQFVGFDTWWYLSAGVKGEVSKAVIEFVPSDTQQLNISLKDKPDRVFHSLGHRYLIRKDQLAKSQKIEALDEKTVSGLAGLKGQLTQVLLAPQGGFHRMEPSQYNPAMHKSLDLQCLQNSQGQNCVPKAKETLIFKGDATGQLLASVTIKKEMNESSKTSSSNYSNECGYQYEFQLGPLEFNWGDVDWVDYVRFKIKSVSGDKITDASRAQSCRVGDFFEKIRNSDEPYLFLRVDRTSGNGLELRFKIEDNILPSVFIGQNLKPESMERALFVPR